MIYGSVCSGIESATVAWHPLGWKAAFYSEIDKFPRAVLQHHYPQVPLHGDFRTIEKSSYAPIDLLVGGTPCQDFSVAGLRKGFAGDRGNLTFEFVHLASRLRPRWLVWENVPGCLSIDGGRGFGTFLGMLGKLGYGFAYRSLDAQYFHLAQRRQRVFVVGYLGDWRRAAAVLFERESLSGNPPPRRETGKRFTADVAPSLTGSGRGVARPSESRGQDPLVAIPILEAGARPGTSTDDPRAGIGIGDPGDPMFTLQAGKQHAIGFSCKDFGADAASEPAPTLRAMGHHGSHANAGGQLAVAFGGNNTTGPIDISTALNAHGGPAGRQDFESETFITHALRADGFDASEDGTGRGTPLGPVAWMENQRGELRTSEITDSLKGSGGKPGQGYQAVMTSHAVRRLTPRECCRLQGFADDYLDITYRGKPAADGPKYKALGNSKAVPVVRWIGQRMQMVEDMK